MELKYIRQHLEAKRRNVPGEELGIVIFKPQYIESETEKFKKFCDLNEMKILEKKMEILSKNTIIALYKNIFLYSNDDLTFGIDWKVETIKYLNSDPSMLFLIVGDDVCRKLSEYKYGLRDRYGKITHPKVMLSREEFIEKVIKNMVHVVDEEEIQNGLWLLFS